MPNYIIVPAIAGLIAQVLNLLDALKADPSRRPNFKDWVYWLPYVIGPILGGFAGYISFNGAEASFTTTLGVQIGISAPLLLKGLASAVPPLTN